MQVYLPAYESYMAWDQMEAECIDDMCLYAIWLHSVLTEVNAKILYNIITAITKV